MTPEQRRKVEDLFHAAIDLPAERRASLLESATPECRREVELLLAKDANPPAPHSLSLATGTLAGPPVPGSTLGQYRIEAVLGQGGMGQVFSAVDTRLGRRVAIKISAEQFTRRFEREARLIGSLNHPHICTLYELGPDYQVMELVEGPTLEERISAGKLPAEETMRLGSQIADGLAAAHAKGIIHRDLKPANLMIAKSGIKILDFGIARAPHEERLTVLNRAIGTPAYMAPEQREGQECDTRSDIYSLGLVLYEMAVGKRLAPGQTPSLEALPPRLSQIIHGCLEPDPDARWQSAADLRKQLAVAPVTFTNPQVDVSAGHARNRQEPFLKSTRLAWLIAAMALVGAGLAAFLVSSREVREPLSTRISFSLRNELGISNSSFPVPSPDGSAVVFRGQNAKGSTVLWLRGFLSDHSSVIAGTEGSEGAIVWSPDGKWIAFDSGGKLQKVSVAGGAPRIIADVPRFQEGAWGSQGDIIFRPSNRQALFRIRDTGGPAQPLTKLNESLTENSHRFPQFLPDGKHFLFVGRCGERSNNALYVSSLDTPLQVKRLLPIQSQASYMPARYGRPGTLVYYRDGAVVAQPFDLERGKPLADPAVLVEGVGYSPTSIHASFSVSADARVVVTASKNSDESRLVWFKRDGSQIGTVGEQGMYSQPRLSPDSARLAFSQPDPRTGNRALAVFELARGIKTLLTTNTANNWFPVWSPDGQAMAFGSDRDGSTGNLTFLKKSMAPGIGEVRLKGAEAPYDWSSDGRWISSGSNDVLITPVAGGASFAFVATSAEEYDGRFSPDVKWIAYSSNESGRSEIYARPFAGKPDASVKQVQISDNGGGYPVWDSSGREIFFMAPDSLIYSVDARGLGRGATVPPPVPLFRACPSTAPTQLPGLNGAYYYSFDTRDGQRFVIACTAEAPGTFTVVTNPKL